MIKGLPLAYNKDLQETQEPLYDAVETLGSSLRVMAGCVAGCRFEVARMREAVGAGFVVATELADYLAARGMPFREAHAVTGALVRAAIDRGVELSGLSLDEMRAVANAHSTPPIAIAIDADVFEHLDPVRAVDRRDVEGGPARTRVLAELDRIDAELAD